jgi:hypothetical protein
VPTLNLVQVAFAQVVWHKRGGQHGAVEWSMLAASSG